MTSEKKKEGLITNDYMTALLERFGIESPERDELRRQYGDTYARLHEGLAPEQRKLLLRLADRGNAILDTARLDAFISGYRLAEGIRGELAGLPTFSIIEEDEERGRKLFEMERNSENEGTE